MIKDITQSFFISLFCITSLYTMDEPFMCKVPQESSDIARTIKQEHGIKRFADRWHWNVDIKEAGRLVRLRENFAKQNNLSALHPAIEEEVHKAFKVCNITEPIIVLQDENSTDESACHPLFDEAGVFRKALVLAVQDERGPKLLPAIRHDIFHECGHLVAGDVQPPRKKYPYFVPILLSASIYAGIRAGSALKNFSRAVRILGGIGAGILTYCTVGIAYNKTVGAARQRTKERNADIFAAKKLIGMHDYDAAVLDFLNYTALCDNGKHNQGNEYWLLHDHPEYLERAGIILDELRNVHVDLNNLPVNDIEDLSRQNIQQQFTTQVKKYFPEYLNA